MYYSLSASKVILKEQDHGFRLRDQPFPTLS